MNIDELDAFRLAGENDGNLGIAILKRGAQVRVRRCARILVATAAPWTPSPPKSWPDRSQAAATRVRVLRRQSPARDDGT
jgi:hypothetical protein